MTMPIDPAGELSQIRSMMERSSRFISLSGLSGVVAGTAALLGVAAAVYYFGALQDFYLQEERIYADTGSLAIRFLLFLIVDALCVASIAIGAGIFFTSRQARRNGQPVWGPLTRRLLISLAIPVITGGLFCAILLSKGLIAYVLPASLIFYGLGLISASKFTVRDIQWLGITEVALGLIAAYFPSQGLLLWAIGFGVMHILYGAAMWYKYERMTA